MKYCKHLWAVVCFCSLFGTISLIYPSMGFSADPITLKLTHQWVQGDVRYKWAENFCSLAEKHSNGSLKFKIFPGGTLMNPKTQTDALRMGAVDLCISHLAYESGKDQLLGFFDLVGVVQDPDKGIRLVQSEIGKKIGERAEKLGMKILSWGFMPTSIGSTKEMILVPKDMKGHKMRGGSKPVEELFNSAGAAITHVNTGEIYMALQTGVLDSVLTADSSFLSFRLFDVLKSLTISGGHSLVCATTNILISPITFSKLSPDQQQAVIRAGKESEAGFMEDIKAVTAECKKAFEEKGLKVRELTDEEYQIWIALAKEKTWKPFSENVEGSADLFTISEKIK